MTHAERMKLCAKIRDNYDHELQGLRAALWLDKPTLQYAQDPDAQAHFEEGLRTGRELLALEKAEKEANDANPSTQV